jgi:hypothetical protein
MNSILRDIQINPQEYKSNFPYPYGAQDNFLDDDVTFIFLVLFSFSTFIFLQRPLSLLS